MNLCSSESLIIPSLLLSFPIVIYVPLDSFSSYTFLSYMYTWLYVTV